MAVINAIASGNWSAPSTWAGEVLPSAGDEVHAAGFTVTLDVQNVVVGELTTTNKNGGVAGGVFDVAPVVRSISANISAGSTTCVTIGAALAIPLTITGSIAGGTTSSRFGLSVAAGSGSMITLNGNANGGSTTATHGIQLAGSQLTVNGDVVGGVTTGYGLNVAGGVATINGDAVASGSTPGASCAVQGGLFLPRLLFSASSASPVSGYVSLPDAAQTVVVMPLDGVMTDFVPKSYLHESMPTPADVRAGVQYQYGAQVGTCAVPPSATVAQGVPVGSSTGTLTAVTEIAALTDAIDDLIDRYPAGDMPVITIPAPPAPTQCAVYAQCITADGEQAAGVTLSAHYVRGGQSGAIFSQSPVTAVSDQTGIVTLILPRSAGAVYEVSAGAKPTTITLTGAAIEQLPAKLIAGATT